MSEKQPESLFRSSLLVDDKILGTDGNAVDEGALQFPDSIVSSIKARTVVTKWIKANLECDIDQAR